MELSNTNIIQTQKEATDMYKMLKTALDNKENTVFVLKRIDRDTFTLIYTFGTLCKMIENLRTELARQALDSLD